MLSLTGLQACKLQHMTPIQSDLVIIKELSHEDLQATTAHQLGTSALMPAHGCTSPQHLDTATFWPGTTSTILNRTDGILLAAHVHVHGNGAQKRQKDCASILLEAMSNCQDCRSMADIAYRRALERSP